MTNLKLNFLSRFSIAQKIWSGFGVILGILLVVVATAVFQLTESQTSVDKVVNEYQPRTLISLELSSQLHQSASALGFYLLSQEVSHKRNYEEGLLDIAKTLAKLKALLKEQDDPEAQKRLATIEKDINDFLSYKDNLLKYSENQLDNFPAIKYAAENINPVSRQMLQSLSNMLINEQEQPANSARKEFLMLIEELRYAWSTVMGHIRTYMILGDNNALENVNLYFQQFQKTLQKIQSKSDMITFEQEEFFDSVSKNALVFNRALDGFVEIFKGDKARMDSFMLRNEVGPTLLKIDEQLKAMVDRESDNISKTSSALLGKMDTSKLLISGLLLIGMVVGIGLSWMIVKIIADPMRKAVEAMRDIARGDGDLTKRLQVVGTDEMAQIGEGFNEFSEKIQNLIGSSVNIIEQVDQKVVRLYDVSQETQQRADKQQLQTEQVAECIRDVANIVEMVTSNAVAAVEAVESANAAADEGKEVVDDTIRSIRSMAGGVESASDAMRSLTAQTDKIGMVVDVIKGIAEQTNLLALNAAIEAARAGEQGRGFAVVADEVRTLASKTQESTDEIESMIKSLQEDAESAMRTMETERERASSSVAQSEKTASAFESIYKSVSVISKMNNEIEQSAQVQQTKTEEVISIIRELIEIAEENAAGAQQTHSAANELTGLESELKRYMNQFKTG